MAGKSFLDEVHGTCPICGPGAHFVADNAWLRDHFLCTRCGSIPRERALMAAIQMFRPEWRGLTIHEASPVFRGASLLLRQEAPGYSYSYFDETRPLGAVLPEVSGRNENIEAMTFADHSFDMFITQDVFEHIFDPTQAIREISRVLRPAGIYIMTVPLVNRHQPSCRRAERRGNEIVHLKEEQYHCNPIFAKGALVTMDWGFDICFRLSDESGMRAVIVYIDDLDRGIRAELNEVVVMENRSQAPNTTADAGLREALARAEGEVQERGARTETLRAEMAALREALARAESEAKEREAEAAAVKAEMARLDNALVLAEQEIWDPSIITRADRARETGQWQLAAGLYRIALDRNSRNPPIWIQYGHALKESGNLVEAETAYRTAIAYDQEDANAHLQLGHVLKLQGKRDEAQAAYRQALAADPSMADAARELAARGRMQEDSPRAAGFAVANSAPVEPLAAEATIGWTARFGGKRKVSTITRADRARSARQWPLAARLYRKALDRNPNNPPIWVQYGHALKESGKPVEAESVYRAAIAYDPGVADSHLQLGHVLKIQGKHDEAEAAYLRAFALDPMLRQAPEELGRLGWSAAETAELALAVEPPAPAAANGEPGSVDTRNAGEPPSVLLEEQARQLRDSSLFDAGWYLSTYPDVAAAGMDPLLHYLHAGAAAGRNPSLQFDTRAYLRLYPDVAQAGVNPLLHYVLLGRSEERRRVTAAAAAPISQGIHVPDLFELRGLKPRGRIAVVLHMFHPSLWSEMRLAIERILQPFDLFVSLVKGASEHMRTSVLQAFPHAYICDFDNHGRDIGPFLVFLQSGVLFQYDLICKLHTKRSLHRADGDAWRRALIDGVLGSSGLIDQIIASFRADPDLGMVVADGQVYRGAEQWAANERRLAELLSRIGISPDVGDRSFPGGSIFWIRSFLLRTLAGAGIKLADFESEPLSLDGGLGHAVERMFGLICEDAGMSVIEHSRLAETVRPLPRRSSKVNLVAFYLPQFHRILENDKWWGEGFTEWTNVTRAKPLFAGHRQPRLPSDLGFYDLRLPETREAQADLARKYGLAAFCYYYYWFNGRRILERPLNEVLASGKPDFPFLICWANEPWTRNWDGLNRDFLLPQIYEPGWATRLAHDIAPLLRDSRYFRLDGKPMLLIYRIGHIPEAGVAIREIRAALLAEGIPEVHLAAAWAWFPEDADLPENPSALGLDAYFEIPPHNLPKFMSVRPLLPDLPEGFTGDVYDYNSTVTASLALLQAGDEEQRHRGVMAAWDCTARRKTAADIFHGATPTSFRRWLRGVVEHESRQQGERVVFINAWNEWAEGTYLEPDSDFGCGWLEAVASVAESKDSHR